MCSPMPRSRANAAMRSSSAWSNRSPKRRRTGVSMEMTDTGRDTRPPAVRSMTPCTSSRVNVARPGASGMMVMPLSVCTQSPESL